MKIRPKIVDFRSFCVELWPKQVLLRISVPMSYIDILKKVVTFIFLHFCHPLVRVKLQKSYGSFPFVSQPHGSESDYQNVEFLTFINPEHVIYDIGTEILCKTCFGHNSTQNAPKSINPVRFYTVFCVDSESAIKTRFKALFKN